MKRVGIGIDVSKDKVDVALDDNQWHQTFKRTRSGLSAMTKALVKFKPHRVVVEPTGGYEKVVLEALHEANLAVTLVQPHRARSFMCAAGQRAKTDRVDAQLLALMAVTVVADGRIWAPPPAEVARLRALSKRRHQILKHIDAEQKRRQKAPDFIKPSHDATLRMLKQQLAEIEAMCAAAVAACPDLAEADEELQKVKGVGPRTAHVLLAEVPELGRLDRKEVASLVGLAPYARQTGTRDRPRSIHGGRARPRKTLYMAALSATRHNPIIREFYLRLLQKGKKKKVALVACMRKLLIHLNSRMKALLDRRRLAENAGHTPARAAAAGAR